MARCEDEDDDDGAVPGYRNYLVYSDESGIHGAKYYGFGTLWCPTNGGATSRQWSPLYG